MRARSSNSGYLPGRLQRQSLKQARSAKGERRQRAPSFSHPPASREAVRGEPGLRVLADVVGRLDPGSEKPVSSAGPGQLAGPLLGQLGQELAADGAEEPLNFPRPSG